jgi:hypothetical protein
MSQLPYFFDEELNKVSCHTYNDFLKTINILTDKDIDVNRCGFTTPYNIFFVDGDHKNYFAWYNMFAAMKEDFGIDIDLKKSFKNLSAHYLYFNENPFKNVVQETVEESIAPLISLGVDDTEETIADEAVEGVSNVPDYEFLMAMYDDSAKAKSKDALERYCIKHYNINLRKNQPFDKMIVELRGYFEDK